MPRNFSICPTSNSGHTALRDRPRLMGAAVCATLLALLAIAGAACAQTLDPTPYVVHPPAGDNAFAFRHVGVVDAVLGMTRADMLVVVEGARITLVAPEGLAAVPDGIRSIDASGRYLIPGLWDMHVHAQSDWSESGPLLVTYGVTGIREAPLPPRMDWPLDICNRHGVRMRMVQCHFGHRVIFSKYRLRP
jgi:hypothetical protein